MYALFKGDQQISKAHKHYECAMIEAMERGLYTRGWRNYTGIRSDQPKRNPIVIRLEDMYNIKAISKVC